MANSRHVWKDLVGAVSAQKLAQIAKSRAGKIHTKTLSDNLIFADFQVYLYGSQKLIGTAKLNSPLPKTFSILNSLGQPTGVRILRKYDCKCLNSSHIDYEVSHKIILIVALKV